MVSLSLKDRIISFLEENRYLDYSVYDVSVNLNADFYLVKALLFELEKKGKVVKTRKISKSRQMFQVQKFLTPKRKKELSRNFKTQV